jgi:hypothetical protein
MHPNICAKRWYLVDWYGYRLPVGLSWARAEFSSILVDEATFANSLRQLQNNKVNSTYLRYVSRKFSDPAVRYHPCKKGSIMHLSLQTCNGEIVHVQRSFQKPRLLHTECTNSISKVTLKSMLTSYIKYRQMSFILVQFSPWQSLLYTNLKSNLTEYLKKG